MNRIASRRGARSAAAHLAAVTAVSVAASFAVVAPAAAVPATYQGTTVQTIDLSAYATPSPDPAGITYMPETGRLFISDSEVDEMPIFQNANLYEVSRAGALVRTGVTTPWSYEPSGVSWDPVHETMYVTDDDLLKVFVVKAGADQLVGTADDEISSFSVTPFGPGSADPQGPAYDTATGDLYVVDGGGNTVYRIQPGPNGVIDGVDDVYSHFAMPAASGRPGGMTYDPVTNTLFVCDNRSKALYQLDPSGNHLSTVQIPATAPLPGGCDVAVAPSSTDPGRNTFWVTTRGLDNNTNPGENDGKLFELASDLLGQPGPGPVVGAPTVTITAPAAGATLSKDAAATLKATAGDGNGHDLTATISWSSDKDGPLGTGGEVHKILSQGTHTITASVAGASANVTVQVVVGQMPVGTQGYHVVSSNGAVFSFGAARDSGSADGLTLSQKMISMTSTPSGSGYWLLGSDGGIFSYGDARFFGSTGNIRLARPVVGMTSTPSGMGYRMVASDGGIFSYGDAGFHGSTGNIALAKPIVGMASTPSGKGYWLVASDGGIFAFGDAKFFGSTGNITLAKPIVGMASTPSGGGYWMVASDGGIFAFGDAKFFGSTGNITLAQPIVGMAATRLGRGYWFVASDGGIFAFGDATFLGSVGNTKIKGSIVGMSAG